MDSEIDDTTTTTDTPGKERRKSVINRAVSTVTVDGIEYAPAMLNVAAQQWCLLNGIRRHLLSAKDPTEAWFALSSGILPSDGAAKPKELDPWRKAYALALADKDAKAAGIKARTPEFATLLDDAMTRAAGLDRDALKKAKTIPAVVVHWNKLTGAEAAL